MYLGVVVNHRLRVRNAHPTAILSVCEAVMD